MSEELVKLLNITLTLEDTLNEMLKDIGDLRVRIIKTLLSLEKVEVPKALGTIKARDVDVILKDSKSLIFKITTERLGVVEFEVPLGVLEILYHKLKYFRERLKEEGVL